MGSLYQRLKDLEVAAKKRGVVCRLPHGHIWCMFGGKDIIVNIDNNRGLHSLYQRHSTKVPLIYRVAEPALDPDAKHDVKKNKAGKVAWKLLDKAPHFMPACFIVYGHFVKGELSAVIYSSTTLLGDFSLKMHVYTLPGYSLPGLTKNNFSLEKFWKLVDQGVLRDITQEVSRKPVLLGEGSSSKLRYPASVLTIDGKNYSDTHVDLTTTLTVRPSQDLAPRIKIALQDRVM